MNNFKFVILLLFLPCFVSAQNFGNEWINYSQQYFKFPIVKKGVYRLQKATLQSAGVPVESIDPRCYQIYCYGKEIPLFIPNGQSVYILEDGEFIEFFADKNNGSLDSIMYDRPSSHVNPNNSIVNDTLYYFLTWNSSFSNSRYILENDNNYSAYNASPYCIRKTEINFTNTFYGPDESPFFNEGEGWFYPAFGFNQQTGQDYSYPLSVSLQGLYSNNLPVKLSFTISGISNSNFSQSANHHLRVSFGNTVFDTLYIGRKNIKKEITTSASSISENSQVIFSVINNMGAVSDLQALAYLSCEYASMYNFNGNSLLEFYPVNASGNKTLLNISNFTAINGAVLLDIANKKRCMATVSGSSTKALLDNNGSLTRKCILVNSDSIKNIELISSVSSNNKFTDFSVIGRNSNFLIITHKKLLQAASEYKNYRDQRGLQAALIDIDELYSQFAYGVNKHPASIRNFLRFVFNNWDTDPEYMFLIGKSIHSDKTRYNSGYYNSCLIPSIGNPSSDAIFSYGILQPGKEAIATGRLSAQNESHVRWYLEKVKEHESNLPAEWMKTVLHFGGGASTSEQNIFKNYLNIYKNTIEGPLFGGLVRSFFKTSSLPIQITQTDTIKELISSGTTLMTFFGHASGNGWDQNIEDPQAYENRGKYPFILANSCFVGDIHQPASTSMSEKWVAFQQQKGAIGFLASVGPGYAGYLHGFSNELYKQISTYNYGKSIGKSIQRTISNYLTNTNETNIVSACLDFTLHGDPSIVLNSHPKTDLTISQNDIELNPGIITAENLTFQVSAEIKNIGMATDKEFVIEIQRTYPDNTSDRYLKFLSGCDFSNTFSIDIPVNSQKAVGLNTIKISLDINDSIAELSELNNIASRSFLITSSDIVPVFPYKYAIYPSNSVTLKASTGNPFIGAQLYSFEIDTTDSFTSPATARAQISGSGGVISWPVPFSLTDSTVYFWRVSPSGSGNKWKESSFQYIQGKTGWSQANFFQFKNNNYEYINYNKPQRKFDYITTPKRLHVHNVGSASNNDQFYSTQFTIDNQMGNGYGVASSCGASPVMIVVIIDSTSLKAWPSDIENYGQRNFIGTGGCPVRTHFIFDVNTGANIQASMTNIANMFTDIEPGHFILCYSFMRGNFQQWPEEAYQAFESLGAGQNGSLSPRFIADNIPYIFFCRKGYQQTVKTSVGSTPTDVIELDVDLYGNFYYGNVLSEIAGPTTSWDSLHWDAKYERDTIKLGLVGIKENGDTATIATFRKNQKNISLENIVDAAIYPQLKLRLFSSDDSLRTPAQLKRWQIIHEGLPETAINPSLGYYFYNDTVSEGEKVKFSVAFQNISALPMDSLVINYSLQDKDNNVTLISSKKLRKHPAGDIINDTISFSTMSLPGLNSLWIEANPMNQTTGKYYQPEQYHFNNIAQKFFYVKSDKANPILDVTFDGVHIMNGDIVSAKPEIIIQLIDENKYKFLTDTSLFAIYLTPQDEEETRIYFNAEKYSGLLKFFPAVAPENKCKIVFNPQFSNDGKYTLRIQAKDKSSNESGENDYLLTFEVITKSTITEIFNYPNPFTTSTRFVFTLTGSELPHDFRIQIYTVTGKLVKTIGLDELGSIHIGRNITQYSWNGTDDFGDRLANGVYFYRAITSINGKSLEKRTTEADHFFKDGFGKLYLMK